MIVVVGEDVVDPCAAPAIPGEQLLAARGVALGFIERLREDEERQRRVVRDAAVVLEAVLSCLLLHRVLPMFTRI